MRISDWSSDVCSSDLSRILRTVERRAAAESTDVLAVGGLQGLGVVAHAVGDDRGDGRSGCPEVGFQPVAESVVQSGAHLSFCLSDTGGREEGLIPSTRSVCGPCQKLARTLTLASVECYWGVGFGRRDDCLGGA